MRRRQKVVAEATGFVIRRRRSDAMPSPHALLEAPPTALLSSLFFHPTALQWARCWYTKSQ